MKFRQDGRRKEGREEGRKKGGGMGEAKESALLHIRGHKHVRLYVAYIVYILFFIYMYILFLYLICIM